MEGVTMYILIGGCISDRSVIGVFSSVELAEQEKQWYIDNDSYYKKYPNDLDIEIFALDNGKSIIKNIVIYQYGKTSRKGQETQFYNCPYVAIENNEYFVVKDKNFCEGVKFLKSNFFPF